MKLILCYLYRRRRPIDPYEAALASSDDEDVQKKDKKLVFLSRTVLKKVRERPMVTGTQIANEIFQLYSNFVDVSSSSASQHAILTSAIIQKVYLCKAKSLFKRDFGD